MVEFFHDVFDIPGIRCMYGQLEKPYVVADIGKEA